MNICMVLAGHDFPPDVRVEKETRALLAASHHVVIVCNNHTGRSRESDWEGARVIRLSAPTFIPRKLASLRFYLTFYHSWWAAALGEIIVRRRIKALHVHDLPMAGTGLIVGRRAGIPVILDLHENYPALLQLIRPPSYFWRLVYDQARWERYERRCVNAASQVIVVVEEARDRLMAQGLRPECVTVVSNTEDVERFTNLLYSSLIDKYRDRFVLSYIGGFTPHRGLDIVLRALPEVIARIPEALLLLVGDGCERASLEHLARELGVADHVVFTGWQPFSLVPAYTALSDVCLVPHARNPHTDSTVPHKLFQYMAMAKPVVVSDAKPLKRIIEDTGCGVVFEAENSRALATVLVGLQDEKPRQLFGERGREAAQTRYHWRHDASRLVEMYARLNDGTPYV